MIKTIAYNDFTSFSYSQRSDFPFLIEEFRTFVANGGNLNYPVLINSDKVEPFEKWFSENFKENPEYFKQLIDEKLITNPFDFIVDHDKKTITDLTNYGLYWMSRKFDMYEPYIVEGIHKLAIQIKDWELGLGKRSSSKFPTYFEMNYNGELKENSRNHPLYTITEEITKASIFEAILSVSPSYTKIWDDKDIERIVGSGYRMNNAPVAKILYDYDIGRKIFNCSLSDENKTNNMHAIISEAVYKDDINFVKKHINHLDIPNIEKTEDIDNIFIPKCRSKEMTLLLIKHGAFVSGIFKTKINKEQEIESCISESIRAEALSAVLETHPDIQKDLIENPTKYFRRIFETHKYKMDKIKLVVEQYNYPLDQSDLYAIANSQDDSIASMKWFLTHGADPRNCDKFISKMVGLRSEGIKKLKLFHKENLLNCFYPDAIFHVLSSDPTKEFTTWLDKAPSENFSRYTKEGYPAWWGANNEHGFNLIQNKVTDFTQRSQHGTSIFSYAIKNNTNKNYLNDFIKNITATINKISKKQNVNFDIAGVDTEGNNLFHYLFTYNEYRNNEINQDFVSLILDHTNSEIGNMLLTKNKNNISPLSLLLSFKELNTSWRTSASTKIIFDRVVSGLDFGATVNYEKPSESKKEAPHIETTSIYDACKMLIKDDDEQRLKTLDQHYNSWTLYHKLNDNLNTTVATTKKIKM